MSDKNNENMRIYEKVRTVPVEFTSKIEGGKLAGMTNIRPIWRIAMLTEIFGPCGIGWYIDNVTHRIDCVGEETIVVCSLDLHVKWNGEWSMPIHGVGASKYMGKGKGRGEVDDEAPKMAETDALSVACKNLGFAADIYSGQGVKDNKYDMGPSAPSVPLAQAVQEMRSQTTKAGCLNVWYKYAGAYGSEKEFKDAMLKNSAYK